MLDIAREKNTHGKIEYVPADAMDLPFAAGEFDALTIAFGIRNVTDPAQGPARVPARAQTGRATW